MGTLKYPPGLAYRPSLGSTAEPTSFTSDNMHASTNKCNQQFTVNYYRTLHSESTDAKKI